MSCSITAPGGRRRSRCAFSTCTGPASRRTRPIPASSRASRPRRAPASARRSMVTAARPGTSFSSATWWTSWFSRWNKPRGSGGKAFNVGTGRSASISEIWRLVADAAGTDLIPTFGPRPGRRHASRLGRVRSAAELLGFSGSRPPSGKDRAPSWAAAACGQNPAAFDGRCIRLTGPLRGPLRCVSLEIQLGISSLTRLVSRAPRPSRRSRGFTTGCYRGEP